MSIWKDLVGSLNDVFQVGLGTGQKTIRFGDRGSLTWNPSGNRTLTLPNRDGAIALLENLDDFMATSGAVPWTQFVYQNNWGKWVDFGGFATPSYRKLPGGLLEIKGNLAKSGGVPAFFENITLLPISCAPSEATLIGATSQVASADAPASLFLMNTGEFKYRTGGGSWLSIAQNIIAVDQATALFLGDSNTYGSYTGSTVTPTQRFSFLVSQSLGCKEDNEGINGSVFQSGIDTQTYADLPVSHPTISPPNTLPTQVTNGFTAYGLRVVSQYPDYLFVMYGTNDVISTNPASTPSNFRSQLDTMIADLIKKKIPSWRIVLASIPPINPSSSFSTAAVQSRIPGFNQAIADVARSRQVKFADANKRITDNGGFGSLYQSDGLHLNAAGHVQIQQAMLNAVFL